MRPDAVIFDCDGVVVDSEAIAFDLLSHDLAHHGLPLPRPEMERHLLGLTLAGVAAKATSLGASLPADWTDDFYERLYARLEAGAPLVPGVTLVFDALDRAGIPYAIGSNGSPRKMQITLGQHPGLIARFRGRIFSGQETARPKPFPDLFLKAAAAMSAEPAACVVIEDSPTGARAARAAGMRCLGFAPHGGAALAAEGATLFPAMSALPRLLGLG